MKHNPRITPAASRLRDWGARQANDKPWAEKVARWIGAVPGVIQLRWKVGKLGTIPWTPMKRSLAEATVALITTGGVHLCSDKPFILKSDAARDLNLIFPLERLLELEAQGIIGHVAEIHYGFGFTDNPRELLSPGHKIGTLLAQDNVDLILLVPA
jgi:D-proline reductase (dithiol) PrdB